MSSWNFVYFTNLIFIIIIFVIVRVRGGVRIQFLKKKNVSIQNRLQFVYGKGEERAY